MILWLLTFSAGDFSAFSSSISSCHCFVSGESSRHQLPALCVRSHANGRIWPPEKQPLPARPWCIPSGKQVVGQNGSRQQAASWTMLRTLKKKKTSLSLIFLLLLCPWTCTSYSVSLSKTLK